MTVISIIFLIKYRRKQKAVFVQVTADPNVELNFRSEGVGGLCVFLPGVFFQLTTGVRTFRRRRHDPVGLNRVRFH